LASGNADTAFDPGREYDHHRVLISTDRAAVEAGTASAHTVHERRYQADLLLDTAYYWQVNEVAEGCPLRRWSL
jgi:hypothetical protein